MDRGRVPHASRPGRGGAGARPDQAQEHRIVVVLPAPFGPEAEDLALGDGTSGRHPAACRTTASGREARSRRPWRTSIDVTGITMRRVEPHAVGRARTANNRG
jgi:hypothetical protein